VPFLKFSLDKRGNEITSIVYQGRRQAKGHPRVLYWFRTPPGIRVGRAAIDEDAIRVLEENHPDLQFDWPRILQAHKARGSSARAGTAGGEVRPAPGAGRRHTETRREAAPRRPEAERGAVAGRPEGGEQSVQLTAHDAPAGIVSQADIARLRGRHAEVLARISQLVGDPARADALRLEAEALNPDAWVTPEEVRQGLASFERVEQGLRAQLGSRQRTRRGGARHRRRRPAAEKPAAPATTGSSTDADGAGSGAAGGGKPPTR